MHCVQSDNNCPAASVLLFVSVTEKQGMVTA